MGGYLELLLYIRYNPRRVFRGVGGLCFQKHLALKTKDYLASYSYKNSLLLLVVVVRQLYSQKLQNRTACRTDWQLNDPHDVRAEECIPPLHMGDYPFFSTGTPQLIVRLVSAFTSACTLSPNVPTNSFDANHLK